MPTYVFRCSKCRKVFEKVMTVPSASRPTGLPEVQGPQGRAGALRVLREDSRKS